MFNSNELSKRAFVVAISSICFFSFLIQLYYIGSLADSVASVLGYFFAVFIAPLALAQAPTIIFLFATSKSLSQPQKIQIFIWPTLFVVVLISYFYWMLQYGAH
jgi:hypothetical protein